MKKNYILKIALVALMFLGKSFSGFSQTDHERLINWLQTWQAAPLFEVNWGTAENLASCTGVTILMVDGEERLQSLSLQGYGIVSELPQDIGALSYMEELNLSENYLIGGLPASMEELYNLRILNLENNQLSGAVPNGLANLGALEQLNLMKNRFSGSIPSELGNLASLVRLELGYNRIMGTIPFSLGNLTNLEVLDLSVMGIAGDVPATLGKLANLKELLLFGSIDLTGPVPPTLTNIAGLEKLYYANTGLCTPTTELFLDWLATVTDVVGNEGFCDCTDTDRYVLNQIARLTNIVDWTTSTNWQSALPLDQWHGVTTSEEGCVVRLELPSNNVVGNLPEITFYMEGLQVLDLSENTLSGAIPNKVNIPSGFQHINLGDNQLSGNLPLELADLAALQHLDVSGNDLYGSIPTVLKEPMVLEHLDLADNGFSGTIPETLGTLSGLQYLDLGHNNLIGQIPASLGGLVQLATLNLSHNLLEGEVPDTLNALVLLDRLYLNDNWGLVGEVPVNFTALAELDSFHFHNTQLCEPEDTAFQTWITGITDLMSTGVSCCEPGWEQTQKVEPEEDIAKQFGISSNISGNMAIVGANYGNISSGSAHVYTYISDVWNFDALLKPNDGKSNDHFGTSVAISGDYAIVGADRHKSNGLTNSGAAYIFEKEGGVWIQKQKLVPNDGSSHAYFGISVDIDGEYAVVGAYQAKENGIATGAAYVFERIGGIWQQVAKLIPDDAAANDHFGFSVAIHQNQIIVGSEWDDDMGANSGSAYIFQRNGGVWQQEAKLLASDGASSEFFGNSLDIIGNSTIVGARGDDDMGANSGSAYIFEEEAGVWVQKAKLLASNGVSSDIFGFSVSISENYAISGAFNHATYGFQAGASYIYKKPDLGWTNMTETAQIGADDAEASDRFGRSVAVTEVNSQAHILVGAYWENAFNGSAYFFQYDDCGLGNGLAPQETSLQENQEMMVQEQGTAPVTATQSLKVVPNPVQELASVSFEMENQGQAVITVLDLNGTEMYQSGQRLAKGFHEETINVGQYRKGIYIVNVETAQGTQQFKFIKE